MNNPTKQQWQTVIDNLEFVLPISQKNGNSLDILCTSASANEAKEPCGTVACVGGWYLISKILQKQTDDTEDWSIGGDLMAKDLGFEYQYDDEDRDLYCYLRNWAYGNEEIWGNPYGIHMFSQERAYGVEEGLTLQKVIDWLKQVKERTPDEPVTADQI